MTRIALLGTDYKPNNTDQISRQLVNMVLEPNEGGEGWTALPTPGYDLYKDLTGSQVRAMFNHNGTGYVVMDAKFYELADVGLKTFVQRGTLNTNSGRVSIAAIEDKLVIVDGTNGYSYIPATTTFSVITDTDFIDNTPTVAATQDYFIIVDTITDSYFHSTINSTTDWPALNKANAEIHYDKIVTAVASNTRLWLLGQTTTEVWYNKGNPVGSVFSRASAGAFQYGCGAAHSAISFDNQVYFLATNDKGVVGVMQASESSLQIISSPAMVQDIEDYYVTSDAFAFIYQFGKHAFYQITFPSTTISGTGVTWLYDISTNIWSRVESDDVLTGVSPFYNRHTANCHMLIEGRNFIGDYQTGKIFELKKDEYKEADNYIRRRIVSQHITNNDKRITMSGLTLRVSSGVGLTGTGQGTDPQLLLRVSRDYGHTYGNEMSRSMGKIGEYSKKLRWTRLGTSYVFTVEVTVSDPVPFRVLGMWADIEMQDKRLRS